MLSFNPQSAGRSGNSVPSPQREFILLGSGILTRHGGSSADICFAAEGLIIGLEVAANKLGKKRKMKIVPRSILSFTMALGGQEWEGHGFSRAVKRQNFADFGPIGTIISAASETPPPSTIGSTAKSGPKRCPAAGIPTDGPASKSAPDDGLRAKTYTRTSSLQRATPAPNSPARISSRAGASPTTKHPSTSADTASHSSYAPQPLASKCTCTDRAPRDTSNAAPNSSATPTGNCADAQRLQQSFAHSPSSQEAPPATPADRDAPVKSGSSHRSRHRSLTNSC